ncbi:hypothetical protein D3C76_1485220 [compost metagenome]
MPDMLEHTHADNLVEATVLRQVTVVENLQVDFVSQPFGLDPLPAKLELLFTQSDTEYLGVIFPCSEARKATPTTANVQQVVAGIQAQLATQVVELVLLRLIERVIRLAKVSA